MLFDFHPNGLWCEKTWLCCNQTIKVQISLRICICTVWAVPLLFTPWEVWYIRSKQHISYISTLLKLQLLLFSLSLLGCHLIVYEGCSNMNASSFITFVTYMLRQNGICFYKGLYVTFKLAPDVKKNTRYLSSYTPLNEGHLSILTNSMLRTYTSDIEERITLWWIGEISWKI